MSAQGAETPKRRGIRRGLWIPVVVLVLVAASGVVALTMQGGEDCWTPPRATVGLADDPARATRTLDPDAGSRTRLTHLLASSHWNTCEGPSGSRVIGGALLAATTGRAASDTRAPAVRHTEAMARVLQEAVSTLGSRGQTTFPAEFRPYAARLLAAWPESVNEGVTGYSKTAGAVMDRRAGEARARFGNDDHSTLALNAVIKTIGADPKSYALLYDALRAHAAASLDPVGRDRAVVTGGGSTAKDGAFARLETGIGAIAVLTHARDGHIAEGRIPDGARFDAAVLRHSRGGYAASARPGGDRTPPEGAAAHRTPTKPARAWAVEGAAASGNGKKEAAAWFMDGRQQLRRTVNLWVRDRHVRPADANRLRGSLDNAYQLGMDLRGDAPSGPGLGY